MKIISDTPCMYAPAEGRAMDLSIIPACTIIDNEVYRDLEDITAEEFLSRIEQGAVPTSSQIFMDKTEKWGLGLGLVKWVCPRSFLKAGH